MYKGVKKKGSRVKRGYDHEQPREGDKPSRALRKLAVVGGAVLAVGSMAYGCVIDEHERASNKMPTDTKCYSPDALDVSLIVRPINQDKDATAEVTVLIDEDQPGEKYNSRVRLIQSLPEQEFCVRALAATQSYTIYYGLVGGRSGERTNIAVALDENEPKPLIEGVSELSDLPPGSQYVDVVVPVERLLEDGSYTGVGE